MIPDDVVERARVVYNAAFVRCNDPLRAALRVAVEWEREQCARVADATAKDFRAYRDHYPNAEGAETVATAIRSRKD